LRIRELLQTNNGFNDYVVGAVCSGSSGNSENRREPAVAASALRSLIGCIAEHRPARSSALPGLDKRCIETTASRDSGDCLHHSEVIFDGEIKRLWR
jgi:hypothetical protein